MKTQLGCKSVRDHSGLAEAHFISAPWNLKTNHDCLLRRNFWKSQQPAAAFHLCFVCFLVLISFKIFYLDCSFWEALPALEVSWGVFMKEGR